MPLSHGLTPVEDSSRQLMHCDVTQRLPRHFVDRMLNEPMHTIELREAFHEVICVVRYSEGFCCPADVPRAMISATPNLAKVAGCCNGLILRIQAVSETSTRACGIGYFAKAQYASE